MTKSQDKINRKARAVGYLLCSFGIAAIAAYVLWRFGEPFFISKLGTGAPWWVYALLFVRPVLGFAQLLADRPAIQDALSTDFAGARKLGRPRPFLRALFMTKAQAFASHHKAEAPELGL